MKDIKEMSPVFKDLFTNYVPGVDFLILTENEPSQMKNEFGKASGELTQGYKLHFDELVKEAQNTPNELLGLDRFDGVMIGRNGGLLSAFDAATRTFIVSGRTDLAEDLFGTYDTGLFVPFSQHDDMPVDEQKAKALEYQETYSSALTLRKEAMKGISQTMVNIMRNAKATRQS